MPRTTVHNMVPPVELFHVLPMKRGIPIPCLGFSALAASSPSAAVRASDVVYSALLTVAVFAAAKGISHPSLAVKVFPLFLS